MVCQEPLHFAPTFSPMLFIGLHIQSLLLKKKTQKIHYLGFIEKF